jgi:aminoglycoside phosphotransferase (APT) family kinase protein
VGGQQRGGRRHGDRSRRASGGGSPWLVGFDVRGTTSEAVLRVGDTTGVGERERFVTEVAALVLAAEHDLPAPRVIATDLDGSESGSMAVLTTVVPGSSKISRVASPVRLRALGHAVARLHAVPVSPRLGLPFRTRSLSDVDFVGRRRSTGTTELLSKAEEHLREVSVPDGATVFVHGDLWQGNTMWSNGSCVGMIDWDCAGAGSPGIDLGSLRCDAALLFDPSAAADVLEGWQRASGRQAHNVVYWDVVAASCTLADMSYSVPPVHRQGRFDLDGATLTARRDAFLSAALNQLEQAL